MSILSVQEIAKRYKFREVVKDISLEISSGEVVGLLGPNGAGKTTAFYMIVGLVAADRGRILLDGKDLTALPMHKRAALGLGYLPQEASIFRKLTVEQNVLAILKTGVTWTVPAANRNWTSCSTNCTSGTCVRTWASACRAASAVAWKSREPSPPTRASSCWTSRSPASTRFRCWISSA